MKNLVIINNKNIFSFLELVNKNFIRNIKKYFEIELKN